MELGENSGVTGAQYGRWLCRGFLEWEHLHGDLKNGLVPGWRWMGGFQVEEAAGARVCGLGLPGVTGRRRVMLQLQSLWTFPASRPRLFLTTPLL